MKDKNGLQLIEGDWIELTNQEEEIICEYFTLDNKHMLVAISGKHFWHEFVSEDDIVKVA